MPSESTACAMVRLSSTEKSTPCVCAPSRSVVSNKNTRSRLTQTLAFRPTWPLYFFFLPPLWGIEGRLRDSGAVAGPSAAARSAHAGGRGVSQRNSSLHFPRRPARPVFQHNPFRRQLVANAIAFLEIPAFPCLVPQRNRARNVFRVHRRL